jgi:hypothetical protein
MYRVLTMICALSAGGLAAFAATTYHREPAESEYGQAVDRPATLESAGLIVEDAEQDLGNTSIGKHAVTFHVTNRSASPGAVVGCPGSCGMRCCYSVPDDSHRAVPPGETVEVTGSLDVNRPGPFEFEGKLYLKEGDKLHTIKVKLTGVGVKPAENGDAPADKP